MDGQQQRFAEPLIAYVPPDLPPTLTARFTAPPVREIADASDRHKRIADLVSIDIVPRLHALHSAVRLNEHPTAADVVELACLVLSPDEHLAAAYVTALRDGGLSVDILFSELLEPAAQRLGQLWDEDRIDFFDVTLGVGRLQALLSVFNCTYHHATLGERRSVLLSTLPGEQHSFGIAMVGRFLEAGCWQVQAEREASIKTLAAIVEQQWFAVVGFTMSQAASADKLAAAIAVVRDRSCHRDIGIMVGGPAFATDDKLARTVGADGRAASGPAAVVLAQKLLDRAIALQATAHP